MLFAIASVFLVLMLPVLRLLFKRDKADRKQAFTGYGRRSFCALLLIVVASGCSRQDKAVLNERDRKFSAFYADYLVLTGIADDGPEPDSLIGGGSLDSLFGVHGLSLESFNERTDEYRENPKLWRAVLQEVKEKLQGNDR